MELWTSAYTDRPTSWQKFLLIFSLIIFLGLCLVYMGFLQVYRISSDIMKQPMNILVMGVDAEKISDSGVRERPRTDTMLFIAVRPQQRKVGVFSIPRDSLVEIPGYGIDRINMAYVYGGYELTKQAVEEVMGVSIQRYVLINFEGFKELVDLVGGVEIEVDKRMLYTDHSAGLEIDLQPGTQTLNGEEALGYVRFRRDPLGDITRVGRQQVFLLTLAEKIMAQSRALIFKLPSFYRIGREHLQTDLSFMDIIALYRLSRRLNLQTDLITSTLPGEFSGPFWSLSTEKIGRMLQEFMR
ncbi:MAG TPA: LCP family protein [Firmicutes bacterium]|nr:LCP family protein [Bacillota bacterium]